MTDEIRVALGAPRKLPEDGALCLWRDRCPLAARCRHALAEPGDRGGRYFAPTGRGEGCRYFDEEAK